MEGLCILNKQHLLELIPTGKARAISKELLSIKSGDNERQNRLAIRALRLSGVPIGVADTGGFYIIDNQNDLIKYAAKVRKQGDSFMQVANALDNVRLTDWQDNLNTLIAKNEDSIK